MKITLLLFLFLFISYQTKAQTKSETFPVFVGIMGHAAVHPGIKIGTRFNLRNWNKEAEDFTKFSSLYISPQIGMYSYPNVYTGYLVNADIGCKLSRSEKTSYSAFSIGLGLLNQSQFTDITIHLNDGSKDKSIEQRIWFLSTLNFEMGKAINEKVGWYGKLSYGYKMSVVRENASTFLIELGVNYNFKKN